MLALPVIDVPNPEPSARRLPAWLKRPLGTAIELLAAIPSIIYGMWGLFVFAPIFQAHVQPALVRSLGGLPVARRPLPPADRALPGMAAPE